jgi:hypothetical protein
MRFEILAVVKVSILVFVLKMKVASSSETLMDYVPISPHSITTQKTNFGTI